MIEILKLWGGSTKSQVAEIHNGIAGFFTTEPFGLPVKLCSWTLHRLHHLNVRVQHNKHHVLFEQTMSCETSVLIGLASSHWSAVWTAARLWEHAVNRTPDLWSSSMPAFIQEQPICCKMCMSQKPERCQWKPMLCLWCDNIPSSGWGYYLKCPVTW